MSLPQRNSVFAKGSHPFWRIGRVVCIAAGLCLTALSAMADEASPFRDAQTQEPRRLWLRGRYAEADNACRGLVEKTPAAAILLSRVLEAQGRSDEAQQILQEALERFDKHGALLHAEVAQLALQTGAYESASKSAALASKSTDAEVRIAGAWVQAELLRKRGNLAEAEKANAALVDQVGDVWRTAEPETMLLLARSALQQARRGGNVQRFKTVVNQMLPAILQREEAFWPAQHLAAAVYAEKYNYAQAKAESDRVLAVNANAIPTLALRGQMAVDRYDFARAESSITRIRRVDADSVEALLLEAQLEMLRWRYSEAVKRLEAAYQSRPHDERTRGILAAALWAESGAHREPPERVETLINESVEANPKCAGFFEAVGEQLDAMRKHPYAVSMLRRALDVDPQRIGPRAKLGQVMMRLGREEEAAKLLAESFELDPYNVRVKNTLEVLDVLKRYAVIETEHFILRFNRGQDGVLAESAAQYLEEVVYPDVTKKLGFEPEGKTLFEIFSDTKNTNAHSWFSARMTGLPFIGTVGACAGKMVALTSPNSVRQRFNWARLLKHEFVHVVNLQQSNFHVPHWFTEAMAVRIERPDRPVEWVELLARRHAANRLFNLDTINLGFVRPQNSDDWTLAYCQSELYAEYIAKTYGEEALLRMLEAFARNETVDKAIQSALGATQEELETGYAAYIAKVVRDAPKTAVPARLEDLKQLAIEQPDNPDAQADYAAALLAQNQKPAARQAALNALEIEPGQPTAQYVMARLELSIGARAEAVQRLEAAYDADSPVEEVLVLLAALRMQEGRYNDAAEMFRNAETHFPHPTRWQKQLARAYLKTDDAEKLYEVLSNLANREGDNLLYRRKLIQLAQQRSDHQAVVKWTSQCLQIDVMDAEQHASKGLAHLELDELKRAIRSLETASRLSPDRLPWQIALGRALGRDGQGERARELLNKLADEAPENAEVKQALKELK